MSKIHFKAKLVKIAGSTILKLPLDVSAKLPSRGLVMVKGTINGFKFETPLEPDGKKSHWLKIDKDMSKAITADIGNIVTIEIEPVKEWPEPDIPDDLGKALKKDSLANTLWEDITPLARWDWIRWINATKNPNTRQIRIEKTFSKLKDGKRTACCFNRTQCTDISVSKNGILLEPSST